MRTKFFLIVVISLAVLAVWPSSAFAYWVWSPDTGKWVNPDGEAKDSPDRQYEWAQGFYDKGDYARALDEFKKLIEAYPNTKLAAQAQFQQGLALEKMGDVAKAGEAFRTLVNRYPYSDQVNEAIEHEFELAESMMDGKKARFLGMEILPATDLATELYEHIVRSAPYGPYGARAQYRLGQAYLKLGEFEQSERALQAVIDEYPSTEYAEKAKYEIARVVYHSSQKQAYHMNQTEEAIQKFQGFSNAYPKSELAYEANEMISELREKKARGLYDIGTFYQKVNKYPSARIYYKDVLSQFPDTPTAEEAKVRLAEIEVLEKLPPAKKLAAIRSLPRKSMTAIKNATGTGYDALKNATGTSFDAIKDATGKSFEAVGKGFVVMGKSVGEMTHASGNGMIEMAKAPVQMMSGLFAGQEDEGLTHPEPSTHEVGLQQTAVEEKRIETVETSEDQAPAPVPILEEKTDKTPPSVPVYIHQMEIEEKEVSKTENAVPAPYDEKLGPGGLMGGIHDVGGFVLDTLLFRKHEPRKTSS